MKCFIRKGEDWLQKTMKDKKKIVGSTLFANFKLSGG